MKKYKRVLSMLLVCCMLVSLLPTVALATGTTPITGTCGDNMTWSLDTTTGAFTVIGIGEMRDYINNTERPWHNYIDSIKSIVISDGVTSVGRNAFMNCEELASVALPNTITSIGRNSFYGCHSLSSITLPTSVTSIGANAFGFCAFESFIIPEKVESIGSLAFEGTNLTSITIPASVISMGTDPFSCLTLEEIIVDENNPKYSSIDGVLFDKNKETLVRYPRGKGNLSLVYHIPDGVKTIASHAFYNCFFDTVEISGSVTTISSSAFKQCIMDEITIPDGVTRIGADAFWNCLHLRRVNIADSVTTIGAGAFDACYYLTDVYYAGNEEMWNNITIYADNEPLTSATIHYNSTGSTDDGTESGEVDSCINGEFDYLSYNNQIATYTYTYKDSWFFESSYTYQHDLVQMSLRTAIAAFDTVDVTGEHSKNIENLMGEIGFQNVFTHYDERSTDSIGYAIANKELTDNNGEKSSLILVAVRGGGYGAEWGGNFRLGDPYSQTRNHQGFVNAAAQVKSGLYNYINDNSETLHKELKVWIVGYSRAAATCNLVAADLTRFGLNALNSYQDDEINISNVAFFNELILAPENIFAFCFECPQTTVNTDANSKEFSNIINIVNPIDFVTKVAMSKLGYRRYGNTLALPTQETSEKYFELRQSMIESYESILRYENDNMFVPDDIDFSDLYYVEDGQSAILDEFMDNLSYSVRNTAYYVNQYQDTLILAAAKELGSADVDVSFTPLIPLGLDMLEHPLNTVKTASLFIHIDDAYIQNPSRYNPDNLLEDMLKNISMTGPAACAHYPELCLAWLDSMDENTILSLNSLYRKIFINCPVNIEVIDGNGEIVAKIVNDVVANIDHGIVAYLDDQGQKVLILPSDGEYNVILNATDNGTVTYTVAEYQTDEGAIDRVVSYFDVPITEGDILTGNVEASAYETCAYPLSLQDKQLVPDIDQQHNGVQEYEITINITGNGTISGEGIYLVGEFAKICATPEKNTRFLGWYENDILISEDVEYRFLVDRSRAISAKFEDMNESNPKVPVTGVTMDTSRVTLEQTGDVYQLKANILPVDATNQTVTWESSNPSVATVTADGLVTAVSSGTATITVTTQDSGYTATCEVTVELPENPNILVAGVELNTSRVELNQIGDVYQLKADVKPADATNQSVSWVSSNSSIATVDDHGLVTAVSEGTATITVTTDDGQKYATCIVTVHIESNSGGTGGGGNSGSTTPTSYTITSGETENGTITISPKTATKGKTITVTAIPDDGFTLETLSVSDKNGSEIELSKETGTSYTFKMPASKVTVTATFAAIVAEPEPIMLPFDDVSQPNWYYRAVEYVYSNHLMQGTAETAFSPEADMSRGMITTVLYRSEGTPALAGDTAFSDVEANKWYTDAIQWAAKNDIVNGYGNNRFGPMDSVTREQLAVILYNYTASEGISADATGDLSVFADAEEISDWAKESISWAVGVGLLSGKGNGILDPRATATRAEVAQMLTNYFTKVI